jgi:F-type H+-transporting ATPase subunit gamma
MTERLAETTRRIENVHQLEAVVTAMRGISVSRVQQAHTLLRGVSLARERGLRLSWQAGMVPHAHLVPALAGRIADALYGWLSDHDGHNVDVIVPVRAAGTGVTAERRLLLPFDFRRFAAGASGQPPLMTLPPPVLLPRLAEEYVLAELCEAALTAFAAENEARVATMLAATGNLESMLSDLGTLERQIRQEEITAEVVELASGAGNLDDGDTAAPKR